MLEQRNGFIKLLFDKDKGAGAGASEEGADPADITDAEQMRDLMARAQSGDQDALWAIMKSNSPMFGFETNGNGEISVFSMGKRKAKKTKK